MHSTGLQYSIVHNDVGQPLLHVQVPEGHDGRELGITYDQAADGSLSIVLEGSDSSELGSIACPGYYVPDDVRAKYSGKHKRFTISLQKLAAAAANGAMSGDQHTLDQRPPAPDTTGSTGEDGSGSEEGEEEEQEDAVCQSGADQPGEGEAKKGKKRRGQKKKKKKSKAKADADGASADSAATAAGGELGPSTPDSTAANNAAGPASANGHARPGSPDSDSTDAFVDACSDEPDEDPSQQQQQPGPPADQEPGVQPPSRAQSLQQDAPVQQHMGTPLPLPEGVAPVGLFVEEVQGSSALGLAEEPPAAPLAGPVVRVSHTRHEVKGKGEDKVLCEPHNTWTPNDWPASTPVSAFGVFDGHGGKMSAVHAAKHLLPAAARLWDHATPAANSPALDADQADAVAAAAEDQGIEEETALTWRAQDALVERLPQSLHAAFVLMDKECRGKFKRSGTTATLAVSVGWELVVANVGDSCAYLDTGAEVVQLTCNHRVAENAEERARILAEGGELSRSTLEGKEVGPLRVWPGGLAMSRTLGDAEAGDLVPGAPAVAQVTLPSTGARLVIASDGVWDVLDPKNAIHTLRSLPASAADKKLAAMAFSSKSNKAGLRDDITALVVDFLPSTEDKVPRGFKRPASATAAPVAVETLQLFRPLAATHSTSWRERSAARRQAALAEAQAAAERAAAEEAAAARAAAAAAAAEVREGGPDLSDTYRELLHVCVDVEAIAQELSAEAAAAEQEEDGEGWTTVRGSHGGAASPEEEGVVPDLEQQMRQLAARYQAEGGDTQAHHQQPQEEGPRRQRRERGGRGRGGRDGRRQGRGGGRWQEADPQQQQQQHPESAMAAGSQGTDVSAASAAAASAAAAAASAGLGGEGGRRGMRREGGRGGRGSRRRSEPGEAAQGAGDAPAQAAGADGWAASAAGNASAPHWEAAPGGGRGRGGRGRGRGRDGPPGGGRHSGRGGREWTAGEVGEPGRSQEGYHQQHQQQHRRGYPAGPRPPHQHQEQPQQQHRHADFRGGPNQRSHHREGPAAAAAAAGGEGGRSHQQPPQQQQEGGVVRVVPRPKREFTEGRAPRPMGEEARDRLPRQEGGPGAGEQQRGSYHAGGRGGRGGYGGRGRGGMGGRGGGRGPRPGGAEGGPSHPQGAPAAI